MTPPQSLIAESIKRFDENITVVYMDKDTWVYLKKGEPLSKLFSSELSLVISETKKEMVEAAREIGLDLIEDRFPKGNKERGNASVLLGLLLAKLTYPLTSSPKLK